MLFLTLKRQDFGQFCCLKNCAKNGLDPDPEPNFSKVGTGTGIKSCVNPVRVVKFHSYFFKISSGTNNYSITFIQYNHRSFLWGPSPFSRCLLAEWGNSPTFVDNFWLKFLPTRAYVTYTWVVSGMVNFPIFRLIFLISTSGKSRKSSWYLRVLVLVFTQGWPRGKQKTPWQGFGSGSVSGSALIWVVGSGSVLRRSKMTHKNRKKSRIFMFLSTGCSLLRAEGFSCSLGVLFFYGGIGISKLQFLIKKIDIKFPAVNFFHF